MQERNFRKYAYHMTINPSLVMLTTQQFAVPVVHDDDVRLRHLFENSYDLIDKREVSPLHK